MFEAMQAVFIAGKCGRQNFDCNHAVKAGVARAIDFAHPARAYGSENLIGPKPRSR